MSVLIECKCGHGHNEDQHGMGVRLACGPDDNGKGGGDVDDMSQNGRRRDTNDIILPGGDAAAKE
jgi:hypothetical protein